jgi:hypothetical protein
MLIRTDFVLCRFRRFYRDNDSRSRLLMGEWYCAVNAPAAFTARKYVTNSSAVARLN